MVPFEEVQKLAKRLLLISLEERQFKAMQRSSEVLQSISSEILAEITKEHGKLEQYIRSKYVWKFDDYCEDFLKLQMKTSRHKATKNFKEKMGIPDGNELPSFLLLNAFDEYEVHIKAGIDKVKLDMLLEMTLNKGSLSEKEKNEIEASVKRAYKYTLESTDVVEKKAAKHMTVILQMLLLSNVPCSHRHYSAIVEIASRLLSSQAMSGIRDERLPQLTELKEFPTLLAKETLYEVRIRAQQTVSPADMVEVCCWLYLIGTGQYLGNKLVATKVIPIEREVVWHFVRECYQGKHKAMAGLVFRTIEGLVAADIYRESRAGGDGLQMWDVNKPPLYDVAKSLDQFVGDIDGTCERILTPLYKQMYRHHQDADEKVKLHLAIARKALEKAGKIIELFRSANKRLPMIQLENLR